MRVMTVVGARPQFIKAAVVSNKLRKTHTEILVHTGQHFDYNMSGRFFEELDIPIPDYNLGISGGTHAEMTGNMMIALEKVMMAENPDCVLVYGDTNSTMAAALAAAKLHISICHVEAGIRTYCRTNPEEINRICTDHVSTLLLASTQSAMECMKKEGLDKSALFVGDPMYDAFLLYSGKRKREDVVLKLLDGDEKRLPSQFYYLTCHREENTVGDGKLLEILTAMNSLDEVTIYPVHPRNKTKIQRIQDRTCFKKIVFTEPVGYLDSICMINHAKKVVTDSGGLQREAFFAGKKCVTILDFVCCPETMVKNRNELSTAYSKDILEKLSHVQTVEEAYEPFGDGYSAIKIVAAMEKYLKKQ